MSSLLASNKTRLQLVAYNGYDCSEEELERKVHHAAVIRNRIRAWVQEVVTHLYNT